MKQHCFRISDASNKAVKKHFKGEFENGRVEFFPVEWRSSLKLDEGKRPFSNNVEYLSNQTTFP